MDRLSLSALASLPSFSVFDNFFVVVSSSVSKVSKVAAAPEFSEVRYSFSLCKSLASSSAALSLDCILAAAAVLTLISASFFEIASEDSLFSISRHLEASASLSLLLWTLLFICRASSRLFEEVSRWSLCNLSIVRRHA